MSPRVRVQKGVQPAALPAPEPDPPAVPSSRPVELALARVHLRLGSLALARVELEILADLGELDLPGQVDLAEVRWRTGDLTGAGEAATVALGAGEDEPLALAVAAEAAAGLGRPTEARRLAALAMERMTVPIDGLFAGIPRSGVWPADATEPPPVAATLFGREPGLPNLRAGDTDPGAAAARAKVAESRLGHDATASETPGLWDRGAAAIDPGEGRTALPDPASELEAARTALAAGSLDDASLRFALALRLAPAMAPVILDATAGVSAPAFDLLRGDAYRLVGLEPEANRAYAAAAWSGARDRRHKPRRARRPAPTPDA